VEAEMKFQKLMVLVLFVLLIFLVPALKAEELLIENFEDGNYNNQPNWWNFDAIQLGIVPNTKDGPISLGQYWLNLGGSATNWYVGGLGTEVKVDATKYDGLQLDVYGTGARSGRLKIELYDDDNNNGEIEQDETKNYAPIYDDRFIYEKRVDWSGWKTLTIPFSEFKDDNPGVGDDQWNPDQKNGSGGLINLQFILIATSKNGRIDLGLDNIKFIKISQQK
jgi:hypothetical protein